MIFRRMPPGVRSAFDAELHTACTSADTAVAWRAAERAHILSQPWPWPHTVTHAVMLRRAVREHDRVEAIGQVIRLAVAGPGSALSRYPAGNTGRARVPLTQPMPLPDDLAAVLADATTPPVIPTAPQAGPARTGGTGAGRLRGGDRNDDGAA